LDKKRNIKRPENTGEIQVNGRFAKGQSGNPAGRPSGARNHSTLLAERLLESQTREICAAVIAGALAGNMQAAKIVLDRILPPKKDRPINIDLPEMSSSSELVKAMACVINAVSSGQISPSEGEAIARILDVHSKTLELKEFEQRLSVLERQTL
jgi:hypothetical protein